MRSTFLSALVAACLAGLVGCGSEPEADKAVPASGTPGEALRRGAADEPGRHDRAAKIKPVGGGWTNPQTTHARGVEQAAKIDNLEQIGICLQSFHDMSGTFPAPASRDQDGKPLLSWRVQILPYLDKKAQALYEEFHFQEPWDSPHNTRLLPRMPGEFRFGGRKEDGKTTVMLLVGKGAPFAGEEKGPRLFDVKDGHASTILAVEAGPDKAVPWTKPEDLPFETDNPLAALGDVPADGFLAVFMDGSVGLVPRTLGPETLRAMITHQGGEQIGEFFEQ